MANSSQFTPNELILRIALAAVSFAAGFLAFSLGVEAGARPGIPEAGVPTRMYYAIGLFFFGGMDLGLPTGGPFWARIMLWGAYFTSPAITAAAVIESVKHVLESSRSELDDLSGHRVIAGAGTLAELYMECVDEADRTDEKEAGPRRTLVTDHVRNAAAHLKEWWKGEGDTKTVVVDKDPNSAFLAEFRREYDAIPVTGDVTSKGLLEELHLAEAEFILLVTGDDLANLEAAQLMIEECDVEPSKIVVHISEIALKRDLDRTDSVLSNDVSLFNSHRVAAANLVKHKLASHFEETEETDEVILAGFGRFGQSLLLELDDRLRGKFKTVRILDHDAELNRRIFGEQVELEGKPDVQGFDADINDPDAWKQAFGELDHPNQSPVVVLGSDNDSLNLRVALWLSQDKKYENAEIFVRTVRSAHLARSFADSKLFEIENVPRHIKDYMNEHDEFRGI